MHKHTLVTIRNLFRYSAISYSAFFRVPSATYGVSLWQIGTGIKIIKSDVLVDNWTTVMVLPYDAKFKIFVINMWAYELFP